jgi:hypothetical protein
MFLLLIDVFFLFVSVLNQLQLTGMNYKAVGHDIISNRMLLAVKNEIAKPLSLLFNRSIQEMVFPDQWKIAYVILDDNLTVEIYPPF